MRCGEGEVGASGALPAALSFKSRKKEGRTTPCSVQVDEELLKSQQAAYSIAGVEEEVWIHPGSIIIAFI